MPFTVFGYGSLVNRQTLSGVVAVERGRLSGWRRAWRARGGNGASGVCSLSVWPAADAIEGLFVTFADDHRERLATREHNYDAVPLEGSVDRVVYRAKGEADGWGDRDFPISRSYLDTTLQGFLREFGAEGVRQFVASTDGWHVPVIDDRAAPRYPRAQALTADERRTIDAILAERVALTLIDPGEAERL